MAVQLAHAGRQRGEEREQLALVDVTGLVHAVDAVGGRDAGRAETRRRVGGEGAEDDALPELAREVARS